MGIEHMRKHGQGGFIVNVASLGGVIPQVRKSSLVIYQLLTLSCPVCTSHGQGWSACNGRY
jgi:hypothetical protein